MKNYLVSIVAVQAVYHLGLILGAVSGFYGWHP